MVILVVLRKLNDIYRYVKTTQRGIMTNMIDEIVNEWSKRIPSGIIDLTNEEHKFQLLQVLNEQIKNDKVVAEILKNIYDNK